MNYISYLSEGLKIFILVFLLGKGIDELFDTVQKKYEIKHSKLYGLLQLFTIITIAYFIHFFTSRKTSIEFQIYNPTVLFSSLMLNIQNTMFQNLDINLNSHISKFLP